MEPGQIAEWITWLVPVIASWLVSQWQRLGDWLKPRANWIKILIYIGFVFIGMGALAALKWFSGSISDTWQDVLWNTLIGGVAGTIIYKIGHKDADTIK